LQQIFLLAAIIVIAVIVIAALLLWQKNRQLRERNRSLYEKNVQVMRIEAVEQEQRKTYSKSSLNDEQRETLVGRIQEVLANPDIICQQDFTLNKLAKMINSNTTYVSQVINETYGMAFSNLLGSRRVHIACQWMEDPARVGSITIEAIASASGFKSRTAFINAFKRETGLTPSEYIRLAASKTR
jgi:AraC-like DNA-binding protein